MRAHDTSAEHDNPNLQFLLHSPAVWVAVACWRDAAKNDWVRLPKGAIKDIVPPSVSPDPEAPGPFSFGDRERVARILAAAGFSEIAFAPFDRSIPFGQGATREAAIEDAVQMAFEVGPLSRALVDESVDVRQRASQAVQKAFARHADGRTVTIKGAAWIVTARNRSNI